MPDATLLPRPHQDLLLRDIRAPEQTLFDAAPLNDPLRFPTLEDFSDEVLDVRRDSQPEACRDLGNYRLVQATHLVQRIRDELEADGNPHAAHQRERLLSGLEALLMDAYLMFARSQPGIAPPPRKPVA